MKSQSGMTLVEITVATIVLSIVLLSAGTIYVAGAKELKRITAEARVQAEASLALDHMWQNLMGAEAIMTFNTDNIVVKIDEGGTKYIKYELSGGKTINFYPPSTANPPTTAAEAIAGADSIALTFRRPLKKADGSTTILNYLTIDITAEKDRMKRSFTTAVVLRGMNP